ncbi:MAG: hypothetical protein H7Y17_06465 [Chlorobia bacterium]|nr:hypothetical protein [Fimbriimonadaceae bacterium]
MPRLPRLKKPSIPLPPSFQLSETDWKGMLVNRDTQRLARHLGWLLADFKSLPRFMQAETCRALNRFVRRKRPLPPEIAQLAPFNLSDAPLQWGDLQAGDILFTRPNPAIIPGFLWAMHYSHVGIYVRPGVVMEANVDKGVRLRPLERWRNSHAHMGFARVKPQFLSQVPNLETAMDEAADNWTKNRIKYNLAMWNEAGTSYGKSYCSELIWMVYGELGLDLRDDPQSEIYVQWVQATFGDWAARVIAEPAIAPDELALSSKLEFYSVGKTR